jgi:hypothetical protein
VWLTGDAKGWKPGCFGLAKEQTAESAPKTARTTRRRRWWWWWWRSGFSERFSFWIERGGDCSGCACRMALLLVMGVRGPSSWVERKSKTREGRLFWVFGGSEHLEWVCVSMV